MIHQYKVELQERERERERESDAVRISLGVPSQCKEMLMTEQC